MDLRSPKNSISTSTPGSWAQPSRNLMTEILLLLIFSGLFFWFIILPKRAAVTVEASDLANLHTQEGQMSSTLVDLQKLTSNLDADQQDVTELDQALPLAGKADRLQALIQALAQAAGVTVGSIDITDKFDSIAAGDKNLLSNPYAVSRTLQVMSGNVYVIGNFTQLEAFLKKVENSGRIIDVTSLNLDGATNGNLNLRIGINSYFLAP